MSKRNNCHRRALEKIAACPSLFGFPDIIKSEIEPNLFERRSVYAQPDVVLTSSDRTVYIIEYKANGDNDKSELCRAWEQLERARQWYTKHTKTPHDKIVRTLISGSDPRFRKYLR